MDSPSGARGSLHPEDPYRIRVNPTNIGPKVPRNLINLTLMRFSCSAQLIIFINSMKMCLLYLALCALSISVFTFFLLFKHGKPMITAASELAMVLTRGLSMEQQKSSCDSLQYSSGYSTQNTTPSCSEDTIPSHGNPTFDTQTHSHTCSVVHSITGIYYTVLQLLLGATL